MNSVSVYLDADDSELRWGLLPSRIRQVVGSEVEWMRVLRAHALTVQMEWCHPIGGDEGTYLEEVVRSSREKCMIYPYHLANKVKVTPFEYYLEMIIETMRSERSYDTIPSFTAADCMRLLGVGRNEFIHALNQCRSKGWLWKRRRAIVKAQLPDSPTATLPVLHWWEVRPTKAAAAALMHASGRARASLSSRQAINQARRTVVDKINAARGREISERSNEDEADAEGGGDDAASSAGREGGGLSATELDALHQLVGSPREYLLAGELPVESLPGLYAAGCIRYTVPVGPSDRFAVPPLKGFVMNRVGNDYLEKVMYEIFVSNDENTTLGNLAALLGQPLSRVTRAVSVACRLGFAIKLTALPLPVRAPARAPEAADAPEPLRHPLMDEEEVSEARETTAQAVSPSDEPVWHESWLEAASATQPTSPTDPATLHRLGSEGALSDGQPSGAAFGDEGGANSGGSGTALQRVALLVDSKLAACLMMTNLAGDLKQHAVTLYEVGKIPHEALDAFLVACADVERPEIDEADVLEYFDQAIALRHAIVFLRSHPACRLEGTQRPLDIVRTESLATLDPATRDRVLQRSYALLLSMAPMEPLCENVYTGGLPVHHFGPTYALLTSPWLSLYLYSLLGHGPVSVLLPRGYRLRMVPAALSHCTHVLVSPWNAEPIVTGASNLLSIAAELLLRAPLLIQEYVEHAAEQSAKVPMPVSHEAHGARVLMPGTDAGDGALCNESGAEGQPGATQAAKAAVAMGTVGEHAAAKEEASRVQDALGLGASIGVIQLICCPRTAPCSSGTLKEVPPPHAGYQWLALAVHFGLPLSDATTCEAVCEQIEQRALFEDESLRAHAHALEQLRDRVQAFVDRVGDAATEGVPREDEDEDEEDVKVLFDGGSASGPTTASYPSGPSLFDGEKLVHDRWC